MAKYIYDSNLEFLGKCTNEELEMLFNILVYDKDGIKRISEDLTNSSSFEKYGNDFIKYWKEIAGELQYYGGNTVFNFFRSSGVYYEEILTDVLEKLKIDAFNSIKDKENSLLEYAFKKMITGMSTEEKMKIAEELNLKELNIGKSSVAIIVQGIIKLGGSGLTKLALLIAGYISKIAVGKIAMVGASRAIGIFTGPIGWGITGAWTILDIASPATRVTIPATVIVSCLRKIVEEREKNKDYKFLECPECGVRLKIKKTAKKGRCPNCEAIFEI